MPAQLLLDFPSSFRIAEEWDRLLEVVRGYTAEMGEKEASDLCDAARSTYNNALAERGDHRVKAPWLVAHALAAKHRKDRRIATIFADMVDCDLTPRLALSKADLDAAKVAELERMAPDLVKMAEERVLGRSVR